MLNKLFSGPSMLPFIIFLSGASDSKHSGNPKMTFSARQNQWVDSVFNSLSPDDRIGQLFMVAAYSDGGAAQQRQVEELITQYHIGGLIFFQGGPVRQAQLTNRFQAISQVPLLIGMDAEWGLGMRLDSTMNFPHQMTLGAHWESESVYRMGVEVARQSKRLGVHLNFAPVVDINSNSANPVIGTRSFGEDKENVAIKAAAYMRGMQNNGIMANAKHFPGHGDSGSDSHLTLPSIGHNKDRLHDTELYPLPEVVCR